LENVAAWIEEKSSKAGPTPSFSQRTYEYRIHTSLHPLDISTKIDFFILKRTRFTFGACQVAKIQQDRPLFGVLKETKVARKLSGIFWFEITVIA